MLSMAVFIQKIFSHRTTILLGLFLTIPGTILFTFADSKARYWSYMFPGFIIGCAGIVLIFITANVAIIATAPHSQSGIVGAVFNSALQLGAAVGTAAVTSIQQNVDKKQADPATTYKGRQAGFWFLVAVIIVELIAFIIFYRTPAPIPSNDDATPESSPRPNSKEIV